MKMECDYLNGWIKTKKIFTYTKILPKMMNPETKLENAEEEEEEEEENPWTSSLRNSY